MYSKDALKLSRCSPWSSVQVRDLLTSWVNVNFSRKTLCMVLVNTKYQSTQNGTQQLLASLVLLNPYFTPLQSIQISVRLPYSRQNMRASVDWAWTDRKGVLLRTRQNGDRQEAFHTIFLYADVLHTAGGPNEGFQIPVETFFARSVTATALSLVDQGWIPGRVWISLPLRADMPLDTIRPIHWIPRTPLLRDKAVGASSWPHKTEVVTDSIT